jgi:hypothetical protein
MFVELERRREAVDRGGIWVSAYAAFQVSDAAGAQAGLLRQSLLREPCRKPVPAKQPSKRG